ncbi:MAG: permease-like cell division protein FtsX [Desulfovibrionaceae bacterium]|nr:permease-like cell division protein FtsX [Desulfovibrionaceae bacterium]
MSAQLPRLLLRGVRDLGLHPWAQVFTLTAVTMVSLLAGLFMLLLYNVDQELLRNRGQLQVQVFWAPGTDMDAVRAQWTGLKDTPGLKDLRLFTPDQALEDLAGALGEIGDFSWLKGDNPLPASALVSLSLPKGEDPRAWTRDRIAALKALPGVDKVHYNPLQMELARGWMDLSKTVVWPVIGFLGLVVALVVGNTMKLNLVSRRDEVEILYLVGAKPWFIRCPLLAGGAVQGLAGGLLSLILLKVVQEAVKNSLNFPPLFLRVDFLPLEQAGLLLGSVALVAVLSSWVAVRG